MKYIFILLVATGLVSCETQSAKQAKSVEQAAADSANYTSVKYLDSAQNLGVLAMGDEVEVTFDFKNEGEKPLYVISAEPSCGCTVADFPKEPVAPDSLGKIVAVFDTKKSSAGAFTKVITVVTNTIPSKSHVLTFSGEVIEKGGSGDGHDHSADSAKPVKTTS